VKDADEWYSRFHDRMAVLLDARSYDDWLDPSRTSGQLDLIKSSAYHRDGELEYFPISTLVNNPSHDAADCLEPMPTAEVEKLSRLARREKAQMELGL